MKERKERKTSSMRINNEFKVTIPIKEEVEEEKICSSDTHYYYHGQAQA